MLPQIWRRQSSTLGNQFRQAMQKVASPAMILTSGSTEGELHGMTLGSVTSVSVLPEPKLSFNLHLPSFTSEELRRGGYCAIHILPPTSNSVDLGRRFAKGIKQPRSTKMAVTAEEKRDGEMFHERTTPFCELKQHEDWRYYEIDGIKLPILVEAERVFICKTVDSMVVDNHEIWVAVVARIIGNSKHSASGGLLYYNRNFHRIGLPLR